MNSIEINTVDNGTHKISLPKCVKKAIQGGLWSSGLIQIACYTSEDQTSGFMLDYNVKTGARKLNRLYTSYLSYESSLKYGRRVIKEVLPIQ